MIRIPGLRKVSWSPPAFSYRLLIKWWMLLRVVLVSTTMTVVWFFFSKSAPSPVGFFLPPSITFITVVVSFLFYRLAKRDQPPDIHYFFQYTFDISLISLLNLITIPVDVNFVPLYVLAIAVASILSFRPGAFYAATVTSIFYLPVGLRVLHLGFSFRDVIQLDILYLSDRWIWLNVGLQVFLFYTIAAITSFLSLKLRSTGTELEDTRRLLRQYRLDTNEILQTINSGLLTCNTEGMVVYANAAAQGILGLKPERMLGYKAEQLFSRNCPEIPRIILLATQEQIVVQHRTVELVKNDEKVPLAVSSSLLREQSGRPRGVSLIFEDITIEAKARELELRGSKLEAVAELAASLAHEIKNPLASIRSAVEMIRDKSSTGAASDKLMGCIIKESDRLTELLKQFLQFSSYSFGPAEQVRLAEVLDEVIQSVSHHPEWRGDIRIEISEEVTAMRILAHRAALSQVFFNLLINAAQVTGPAGEKVSRIGLTGADRRRYGRPGDMPDKHFHRLCLYDDGPGVEPALREKIFEPFYSTRKGGFGLGLAVVHRIISALGGVVHVEDSPFGSGAAFIIYLPQDSAGESINGAAGLGGIKELSRDRILKTGAGGK